MTEERAEMIINCLTMGMTLAEARSLTQEEYRALATAWNKSRANGVA